MRLSIKLTNSERMYLDYTRKTWTMATREGRIYAGRWKEAKQIATYQPVQLVIIIKDTEGKELLTPLVTKAPVAEWDIIQNDVPTVPARLALVTGVEVGQD